MLFIYDCETTGLGIYTEHITEIAAKITGVPLSSISQPTYTSLVKTSRTISKNGMHNTAILMSCNCNTASEKTGISTAMLRGERPLSVVLPEFLEWIKSTTQEYNEASGSDHYPGIYNKLIL